MASPQESITTVNGRRCTRSRVRFAAPSSVTSPAPAIVTTTEITTSTTLQQAQLQTSAAAEAPPAPPASSAAPAPPSSAAPVEEPAAAPTPPAAASSAIGTPSAVSVPPVQAAPLLANIVASSSAAAAIVASDVPAVPAVPAVPVELPTSSAAVASSQVITPTTSIVPLATPSISSDRSITAISSPLGAQSSLPVPVFASPAETTALLPSGATPEQSSPTSLLESLLPDIAASSIPAASSLPTGDSAAGVIAPGRNPGQPEEQGLTIPSSGNTSVGSIVGGVIGGVGGLAVICAILFIFLRRRNREEPRWFEKSEDRPKLIDKLKAIPEQFGVMFAKIKGQKKGPSGNTYQRHSQQGSISSVYSTDGRSRSISEPQGAFAVGIAPQRSSSRASRSSKKGDRNVLRKKNGSISSQSTFAGIMAELDRDPFSDPEPPRTLLLLNPDPNSPRGPITPQPAAVGTLARNPFVSPLDNVADDAPLVRPPVIGHRRNRSSASALSSNPPEMFTPDPNKPAIMQTTGPPAPNQAVLPGHKRRSSMAYPAFNTTSTTDSHDSFYGEPGPTRPPTNLFTPGLTPGLPTGRTVRQSDPFDLDRPEVLGFGNVVGRREVRGSVTRQGTINRRTSTAGNWQNMNDQPYDRDSAVPRPLWSAGGRR